MQCSEVQAVTGICSTLADDAQVLLVDGNHYSGEGERILY